VPSSNGGAEITDYVIQYSTNAGTNWTTFNDGTSTSVSAVVTGLTNGTTYIFKVAATSVMGTGGYSSNSNSVMPLAQSGSTQPGFSVIGALVDYNVSGAGVVEKRFFGGGSMDINGKYEPNGLTASGRPIYQYGGVEGYWPIVLGYNSASGGWYIADEDFTGAPGTWARDFSFFFNPSSSALPPVTGWQSTSTQYVPSLSQGESLNGTYCEDGTAFGRPKYRRGSTNYYIHFIVDGGDPIWQIHTGFEGYSPDGYIFYDSPTPPIGVTWFQNNGVGGSAQITVSPITCGTTLLP
jgi:hypothetical protein